jgi:hypothetical protein
MAKRSKRREFTPMAGFALFGVLAMVFGFWIPYPWMLVLLVAAAFGVWGAALVFAFVSLRSPSYRPANWLRMALGVAGASCYTGFPECWAMWALMMTLAGLAGIVCQLTGQLPDPKPGFKFRVGAY